MPLSEHSQFSGLVCGPPQFIRQIIGALDRSRTYNIYHLKVARLPVAPQERITTLGWSAAHNTMPFAQVVEHLRLELRSARL